MAAASNVIPFWLLYMRPLQWGLRTKGFSLRGNPFRIIKVMRWCLHALVMWKKPWFLSQGPVLGASCRRKMRTTETTTETHGLGSDLRGTLRVCGRTIISHGTSTVWRCWLSCSQEFPSRYQRPPCARPLRQHIGGLLHKSPGGFAVTSTLQTGVPNPPVVPREVVVSSSNVHTRGPQYRSRHPVETGAKARGMEAPPRGGGVDMEGVWLDTSGSVCVSRDVSLSTVVFPHAFSSSRMGRDGADVAEASPVCISPDCFAPGSPEAIWPGPGSTNYNCPAVAGQIMVPRYNIPPRRASSGAHHQEGPSVPIRGLDISPPTRIVQSVGLLRPFSTPELPPRGNFMPWSGEFSLHGVVTISWTQLTAQLVPCLSSCKSGSLQG